MSYGEKITELRKSKGMTQAQLGDYLNVTYQAVSKWERDESDPDFATMAKLARLFDVPLSYFENGETEIATTETAAPLSSDEVRSVIKEELRASAEEAKAEEQREREEAQRRESARRAYAEEQEKAEQIAKRNRGLIWGGIITAILLALAIVGAILNGEEVAFTIGACAFLLIFGYTFNSQLFWGGFIVDVVLCGIKVIGTPGIIFTFDLDGFIFLIVMKVLFAVLKILVLFLCMAFFAIVAFLLSPFTFIPQCFKISRGDL